MLPSMPGGRASVLGVALVALVAIPVVLLQRPSSPSKPPGTSPKVGAACSGASTVTSWVGNTFGGADDKWIQPAIQGLWVSSDGTAYGEAAWNEGARELRGYRDGQVFGDYTYQHDKDIPNGGIAVTGDATYVYAAVRFGKTAGVMRYDRHLNPAPFRGGTDPQGAVMVVNPSYEYLTGLAASKDRLYVADPNSFTSMDSNVPSETSVIRVYDTSNLGGGQVASFPAPRARGMAVDGAGGLWVLEQASRSQPAKIVRFSSTGRPTGQVVTTVANPTAIAVDTTRAGAGHLLVTDDGPDQNVKIFDALASKPVLTGTLGVTGGVLSGVRPGSVGPRRFNGPAGVGVDAAGNIYVTSNGAPSFAVQGFGQGTSLEVYKPDGTLLWQVYGQKYNTAGGIDPQTGRDVYTAFDHYQLDLTKPVGKQWTRVGWTLDRFRYPYDPRINDQGQGLLPSNPIVRTLAGHKFLFMGNGMGDAINIFRFVPPSRTAIPSGSINTSKAKSAPGPGEFVWRDTNGDGKPHDNVAEEYFQRAGGKDGEVTGWWIDTAGSVWQTTRNGIRVFPFGGLDRRGNPIYSYDTMRTFAVPAPFTDVRRLAFDPATDSLTLSGYTAGNPTIRGERGNYKFAGTTLAKFVNFTKRPNGSPVWKAVLPYTQSLSDAAHKPITLSVVGNYAFVGYFTSANNQLNSDIHVFDLRTGVESSVIEPGSEIGRLTGNTDMQDGTVAYQTPAGEYLILNEEDLYNKTVLYRWCPP
jgi:hypothetical protein